MQNGRTVKSICIDELPISVTEAIAVKNMAMNELLINETYSQFATNSSNESDTSTRETAVTGTRYLSNYPIVDQYVGSEQKGLCWAATIASIVRFEKPTVYGSLTAKNVADYMRIGYDDGASNSEAKQALPGFK